GESGLLLGASGMQILLDGVPLGAAGAERSFAQLLSSSGIASIHFAPTLSQGHFARFVRAFPSGNAKPSSLAEQLKSALAGETGIKVNEIRYVAEDSSVAGIKTAANLAAKVLGATGDKFQDLFHDPGRLLQMILAAESARGGAGAGGGPGTPGSKGGGGDGPSRGSGGDDLWESRGNGSPGGTGAGNKAGSGIGRGSGFGQGTGAGSGTGSGTGNGAGPGSGSGSGTGDGTGSGSGGGFGSGSGSGFGSGSGSGRGSGGGSGSGTDSSSGTGSGAHSGAEPPRMGRWQSASALLRTQLSGSPESMLPATTMTLGATYSVAEEEIRSVLSLFSQLGKSRKSPDGRMDMPTFQNRLSALPVRAQHTLQQALAGLAAQAPTEAPDKPMLLKLAEHV